MPLRTRGEKRLTRRAETRVESLDLAVNAGRLPGPGHQNAFPPMGPDIVGQRFTESGRTVAAQGWTRQHGNEAIEEGRRFAHYARPADGRPSRR